MAHQAMKVTKANAIQRNDQHEEVRNGQEPLHQPEPLRQWLVDRRLDPHRLGRCSTRGTGRQRLVSAPDDGSKNDDHDRDHEQQQAESEHRDANREHHTRLRTNRYVGHYSRRPVGIHQDHNPATFGDIPHEFLCARARGLRHPEVLITGWFDRDASGNRAIAHRFAWTNLADLVVSGRAEVGINVWPGADTEEHVSVRFGNAEANGQIHEVPNPGGSVGIGRQISFFGCDGSRRCAESLR